MTSEQIKEYGLGLGFCKVGIAPVESLTGYCDEVLSRGEAYELFLKRLTKPVWETMPNAKSVIVLAWDYFQHDFPQALQEMIGKLYLSREYNPPQGSLSQEKLALMREYLEANGFSQDTAPLHVPQRWAAVQAGVATIGRNTFAYTGDSGSYVILYAIVVDQELAYDQPTPENNCPPNCRACMDACPTKALYAPFKLDPTKCIPFHNFVRQDGRGAVSSFIPYEYRTAIGSKIHGCDICQDVCPRNQKKRKQPKQMDPYMEKIASAISLPAILAMSDEYYHETIWPIMYNYIHDKRYFMRNAALAMGNRKDEADVEHLTEALHNPDAMVREYVVWALEQVRDE